MKITPLKIAIVESGLKQTYIAKRIGIDYNKFSRYVRGYDDPPPEVLRDVAKLLKIRLSDLTPDKR